jgi:hypothetical protein
VASRRVTLEDAVKLGPSHVPQIPRAKVPPPLLAHLLTAPAVEPRQPSLLLLFGQGGQVCQLEGDGADDGPLVSAALTFTLEKAAGVAVPGVEGSQGGLVSIDAPERYAVLLAQVLPLENPAPSTAGEQGNPAAPPCPRPLPCRGHSSLFQGGYRQV